MIVLLLDYLKIESGVRSVFKLNILVTTSMENLSHSGGHVGSMNLAQAVNSGKKKMLVDCV